MAGIKKGQTVTHAGKPEWGPGEVVSVEGFSHEGKPAQRVTVRFSRGGLKTLSTAFADIRPTDGPARVTAATSFPEDDALAEARMLALPKPATEGALLEQISATLAAYSPFDRPSGLIDWATTQSGLGDPLVRFNREQLSQLYGRYRAMLDNHLRRLLDAGERSITANVRAELFERSPREAKAALARIRR